MRLSRSIFALALGMSLGAALSSVQTPTRGAAQRLGPDATGPTSPLTDPVSRGFHYSCWRGSESGCVEAALRMFSEAPRHQDAAVRTLEQSCQRGHGEACHQLANVLSGARPTGVRQDAARALLYHVEGCERGFADACTEGAQRYWRGQIVSPDVDKAVALFERGCELGDPDACLYELVARQQRVNEMRAAAMRDPASCTGPSKRTLTGLRADLEWMELFRVQEAKIKRSCELGFERYCHLFNIDALDVSELYCERDDLAACRVLSDASSDLMLGQVEAMQSRQAHAKLCEAGDGEACLRDINVLQQLKDDYNQHRSTHKHYTAEYERLSSARVERACELGIASACGAGEHNPVRLLAELRCERGDASSCDILEQARKRDPFSPPDLDEVR